MSVLVEQKPKNDSLEPKRLNVFISYSRRDMEFVNRLQPALENRNIEVFVDREDIEKGEEWWSRIKQLVTEADSVVFVLSPDSISSPVCKEEVDFAENLHKRFIPVVAGQLIDRPVPHALARLNYIFFVRDEDVGSSGDFNEAVDQLVRALQIDIAWIREHTRLGTLARRWSLRNQPKELLLRGAELTGAETWLVNRPQNAPEPTDAHRSFVAASRQAAIKRQRATVALSLVAVAVAAVLTATATWQWSVAVDQRAKTEQANQDLSRKLGDSTILEGDKLVGEQRWNEALRKYHEAKDLYKNASLSSFPAVVAEWNWLRERPDIPPLGWFGSAEDDNFIGPNGSYVVSQIRSRNITKIWNLVDQETLFEFPGEGLFSFSNDGEIFIYYSKENDKFIILNLNNRKNNSFNNPTLHMPNSVSISADGQLVLIGGKRIYVWDVDKKKILFSVPSHDLETTKISIAGNREFAITSGGDSIVRSWNLRTQELNWEFDLEGVTHGNFALSPDDELIALAKWEGEFLLLSAETLKEVRRFSIGSRWPPSVFKFSPNNKKMFGGGAGGKLYAWDVATGEQERVFRTYPPGSRNDPTLVPSVSSVAISRDNKTGFSVSAGTSVILWNLAGDRGARFLRTVSDDQVSSTRDRVNSVAVSHDLRLLASAGHDRILRIWDFETGKLLKGIDAHTGVIWDVRFSPSGDFVLSGDSEGKVILWNLNEERVESEKYLGSHDITGIAFSSDGHFIAVKRSHTEVELLRVPSFEKIATFDAGGNVGSALNNVEFAVDDDFVVSGGKLDSVIMWQVSSGKQVNFEVDGFTRIEDVTRFIDTNTSLPSGYSPYHSVTHVAVSPSGLRSAAANRSFTTVVWDLLARTRSRTLIGHSSFVVDIRFLGEDFLVSSSLDGTLRFWEIDRSTPFRTIEQEAIPTTVWTNPDGDTVVTGYDDGQIGVWDLLAFSKYEKLSREAAEAMERTREAPLDGEANRVLGEWFAFNDASELAIQRFEMARMAGVTVSAVKLGRLYWLLGRYTQAIRELEQAVVRGEIGEKYERLVTLAISRNVNP